MYLSYNCPEKVLLPTLHHLLDKIIIVYLDSLWDALQHTQPRKDPMQSEVESVLIVFASLHVGASGDHKGRVEEYKEPSQVTPMPKCCYHTIKYKSDCSRCFIH